MDFKCYHYDIARGAYLKPEIFKTVLLHAAASGFTHFLPYLENMIKLPSLAKACPDCAYTPLQWKEFEDIANKCGIELIPHFNVIGHSKDACTAYPKLSGNCDDGEMDVTLECSKKWVCQCLEEYCGLSSGKHFLIGGDEWQTPNHLLVKPDFNIARTWSTHINMVADVLKRYNKVPIVWHDMLLHYPEILHLLDKSIVIAFWIYDDDSDYSAIEMFQSMGYKTIISSGICNGNLSQRHIAAISKAIQSSEKYNAYGLMVTSWADGRWEKQKLNIAMCGKLINKEVLSDSLIKTISVIQMLNSFGETYPDYILLLNKAQETIKSGVFDEFPDYKQYLLNVISKNNIEEKNSYLRYHYQTGPLMISLENASAYVETSMAELNKQNKSNFSVNAMEKSFGTVIKIINGDESFVVYPKYGGSLQNYRKGNISLIPHSLPGFIDTCNFEPGGYRSYSGVGGFRPIWSFGSHHNPCILWQSAFDWSIDESCNDTVVIKLTKEMYHVAVEYTIIVRKDESGFIFTANAVNKIDNAYGMFSFNLPLSFSIADIATSAFNWECGGKMLLRNVRDTFVVIPAKHFLNISKSDIELKIESNPKLTAGFYTDISPCYITPDLRGYYQKLSHGDLYSTVWKFTTNHINNKIDTAIS